MKRSRLIGIVFAACAFAMSHAASAAALSTNPDACVLVSNTSPYPQISGATGGSGMFTNNSGGYAWAMCPVSWQDGAYNFVVSGSSTSAACYLIAVGSGGGATLYTGSRSGNQVSFYVPLTAGSYNAEIQCYIPNGTSIWHLMNY
jgi:hypothetical protein